MSKHEAIKELPVREAATRSCVHRWVLGEPDNGLIPGRCKRCHATRTYPVNPDGNERFDDYRELTAASSYHWARTERKSA